MGVDDAVRVVTRSGARTHRSGARTHRSGAEGVVLVELKALTQLEDAHWAQVLNYLKACRLEVGLLPNFRTKSLTSKPLVL